MAGGVGVARLATSDPGSADFLGVTLGAGLGFAGGALAAHHTRLRAPDVGAGVAGIGFGALVGTLMPTLGDDVWDDGRRSNGGAWLGLAVGGAGAATAAHLADATAGEVAVPLGGASLGLVAGLGVGLLLPCDVGTCTSQSPRIGAVAGTFGGATLGLLVDRQLRLSEGLGDGAVTLGLWGGAFGIVDGLLLAAALDPSGLISETPSRQLGGGVLMLGSAELAAGLVISKRVQLRQGDTGVVVGGRIAGGLIGLGTAMLARDETGRADTLATLGGSLAGLGAAVVTQVASPLDGTDGAAVAVGAGAGAIMGTLAPTLGAEQWSDTSSRRRGGGFLLGLGAGAVTGVALRHGTGVPGRTVNLTALGGIDGLVSGLGVGLLVEPTDSSRGARLGTFVGTAAGLGMGALVLPRLALDNQKAAITGLAAGAVGGWTGAWLPFLGHASSDDVEGKRIAGGLMAGAGLATAAGLLAEPVLDPDPDSRRQRARHRRSVHGCRRRRGRARQHPRRRAGVGDAGRGIRGPRSRRRLARVDPDRRGRRSPARAGDRRGPVAGRLASRSALRSGERHRSAAGGWPAGGRRRCPGPRGDLERQARDRPRHRRIRRARERDRRVAGRRHRARVAHASRSAGRRHHAGRNHTRSRDRGGVRAAAFAGAANHGIGTTLAGGALGVTESLLFAWSARSVGSDQYGGAALIGGGIGATLGLAVAATPPEQSGNLPPAAGFAAWGAWMGLFTGSLVHNDAHEIVRGGLLGANAGFLGGYALLRTGAVEPSDFGWLSLFGALGTVAGAGVGAPFSTRAEPAPVLAGLAIGPAVGMLGGAILLPKASAPGRPPRWSHDQRPEPPRANVLLVPGSGRRGPARQHRRRATARAAVVGFS